MPLATRSQLLLGFHHGCSSTQGTKICWNHVGVSSNRNLIYGLRTFCSSRDLAAKKCVPCITKDLHPMTEESATCLLSQVAGWTLVNENGTLKLNSAWKVKSFTKGLELFHLIGDVAETEGHGIVLVK